MAPVLTMGDGCQKPDVEGRNMGWGILWALSFRRRNLFWLISISWEYG